MPDGAADVDPPQPAVPYVETSHAPAVDVVRDGDVGVTLLPACVPVTPSSGVVGSTLTSRAGYP